MIYGNNLGAQNVPFADEQPLRDYRNQQNQLGSGQVSLASRIRDEMMRVFKTELHANADRFACFNKAMEAVEKVLGT